MRRGTVHLAALLAALALLAPPRAQAQDPVSVLTRAASGGGVTLAEVQTSGPVAVVDVSTPITSWPVGPDELLAMLAGALQAGSPIDSVTLRVWHEGQWIPTDQLWRPDPDVLASIRAQGALNLGIWKSSPPPPRHWPAAGSLTGTRIFISPGHGWTWFGSSWGTQRGLTNGLIEDFSNAETVNEYLIPMLERMGATVLSCRERGRTAEQVVVDNDGADGAYEEWGTCWRDGSEPGHMGTYRACECIAGGDAAARFFFSMPRSDVYPVYMRWVAAPNRSARAPVTVVHAGGETTLTVNQQAEDDRWTYVGGFHFHADQTYEVQVGNAGEAGTYVIADGVRVGGGMGEIAPAGTVSGHPKWEEAAKYWIQYLGAPSSVYDASYPDEQYSDHWSRPNFAEWEGGDAYLMWHTNAYDGTARGTVTFIHASSPSPGSAALQTALHSALIGDIHAVFDPEWYDRGRRTGDYIELGGVDTMPAVLLELAFHDNEQDAAYLNDPDFRYHVSRAMARGFGAYFDPEAPAPPLPPTNLTVQNLGGGSVRIAFHPPGDLARPDTPIDRYRIYHSTDGRGFDNGDLSTTSTSIIIDDLDWPANHYFLVTSENEAGESMPTETTAVRASWPSSPSPVLLVGGFDRLDRWVREYQNTRDFVIAHGEAIAAAADGVYAFDFATNEAVRDGDVDLSGYQAVVWFTGEESSTDASFDATERAVLAAYLDAGGSAFVSGSEIGWDLHETGTAETRAWLADTLRVQYVSDDADTHTVTPDAGIFDGLGEISFDPADGAPYDADYPDVIGAVSGSSVDLVYPSGQGASIEYDGADTRIVYWGLPFETLATKNARAALMERILTFLIPDVPVPPEPDMEEATEPVDDATEPVEDAYTDVGAEPEEQCRCHTECGCALVW